MRRTIAAAAWLLGFALAAALLWSGDAYWMRLGTALAANIALASAWNLVGGFAGYPSFATAAFFGLGAYAGALAQGAGAPMPLAWAAAALAAGAFALLVGWAVLRLRGHYFAIGSLTVVSLLRIVATNWTDVTGGGMGLNLPAPATDVVEQARTFLLAQATLAAAAVAASALVARSSLGFALACIRQNETAAAMLGLDARAAKAAAFVLSAVLAAPVGAVYASSVFYIEPGDVFDVQTSLTPIIMALLGGAGTVGGPVFGALVFEVLEQFVWARFNAVHAGVLGLCVVCLALFLPRGLLGLRRRAA